MQGFKVDKKTGGSEGKSLASYLHGGFNLAACRIDTDLLLDVSKSVPRQKAALQAVEHGDGDRDDSGIISAGISSL
jgi:hypothetical protein